MSVHLSTGAICDAIGCTVTTMPALVPDKCGAYHYRVLADGWWCKKPKAGGKRVPTGLRGRSYWRKSQATGLVLFCPLHAHLRTSISERKAIAVLKGLLK